MLKISFTDFWIEFNEKNNLITNILNELFNSEILITKPGQALIIDNQICMHRAGYCKSGNRDIIEILCRES